MEVHIPHWLPNFLATPYFVANCSVHPDPPLDVRRYFCIGCEWSICWHCVGSALHPLPTHRFIQVYMYINHCVVRTEDMIQYLNCDAIQNYTLDNHQVVHLHPRRTPAGVADPGAYPCDTCQFEFVHERFCCIACKYFQYPLIRPEEDYLPKKRQSLKRPYTEEGFPDARKRPIFIKSPQGSTQKSRQAMPRKKSITKKGVADVSWSKPDEEVFPKKRFLDQFRSFEEKRTEEGLLDVPLARMDLPEDVLPPKKQLSEGVQAINNATVVRSSQQNETSKCATWMGLPEIVLQPNKKLSSRIACLKNENELKMGRARFMSLWSIPLRTCKLGNM